MDDVLLRDVADRLAEVVEVAVKVCPVGEYATAGGTASAVQAIHQRALPRPTRTKQRDEFTRLDDEIDVVEQLAFVAVGELDHFFKAGRFQPQPAAAVERVNRLTAEREEEGTDAHLFAFMHDGGAADAMPIDGDGVHAAGIDDEQLPV